MVKEQVTLDEVLLSNLLAIRGNKYKDNPECGAAKQIIRKFSAWTINTYPLLDAKHISRELLMEYLFQVAHDTRCSGKIQEYGFAELTGKILSDATGQTVSIYETAIMQPYTLICHPAEFWQSLLMIKLCMERISGARCFIGVRSAMHVSEHMREHRSRWEQWRDH